MRTTLEILPYMLVAAIILALVVRTILRIFHGTMAATELIAELRPELALAITELTGMDTADLCIRDRALLQALGGLKGILRIRRVASALTSLCIRMLIQGAGARIIVLDLFWDAVKLQVITFVCLFEYLCRDYISPASIRTFGIHYSEIAASLCVLMEDNPTYFSSRI